MNLLSIVVFLISILFGLVAPAHSVATELSTAADNLAPGAWARLSNPPTNFFLQGSQRPTLSHLGRGTWDPITHRAYFLGAGREGSSKLHVYDDGTDFWQEGGRIPGFPRNFGHGYNHNALDAGSGTLNYIELTGVINLWQFPIQQTISTANTWQLVSTGPNTPLVAGSLTYFPERGTWVVADGSFGDIHEYNPDTDTWSVIATNPSCFDLKEAWVYSTFAVYLPLRGEVAFGGGNDSLGSAAGDKWCTVDEAGTVVQQPDAPTPLSIASGSGPGGSLITADPGSGDLLVLSNTGQLHAFDFLTGFWGLVSDVGRPSIFSSSFNDNVLSSVAVPINTYGVIMYAKAPTESAEVWIYKHTDVVTPTPPPPPPPPD